MRRPGILDLTAIVVSFFQASFNTRYRHCSDDRLMTSRDLTSGSGFSRWVIITWQCCIFVPNLVNMSSSVQYGGHRHVGSQEEVNFACFDNCYHACALYQIWFKYLIWYTHFCLQRSTGDVTRNNFRFPFWSRDYLRMALLHFSVKVGANIFIQSWDIRPIHYGYSV